MAAEAPRTRISEHATVMCRNVDDKSFTTRNDENQFPDDECLDVIHHRQIDLSLIDPVYSLANLLGAVFRVKNSLQDASYPSLHKFTSTVYWGEPFSAFEKIIAGDCAGSQLFPRSLAHRNKGLFCSCQFNAQGTKFTAKHRSQLKVSTGIGRAILYRPTQL
ncbi:hypothetical protein ARMSODRAFT_349779 [Armillaria solidipes]|uniref:Uncharacterized protein n=1 Tax=Armillaria solidipes TaxID=1076256 RepID=A0A2H3BHK9_9AGAR|nr:hypothetical protein ARMSODRAFT_349779 [Armillaria solidipes]